VGQADNVRDNLGRAYELGLASVRRADGDDDGCGREEVNDTPVVLARPSVTGIDDLDVPRGLRVAAAWAWRVLVLVAAAIAVLWLVGKLQLIVVPLVVATLLTALLSPVVSQVRRAGVPRSVATPLVMVAGLAAVGGTLFLVVSQFISGAPELGQRSNAGLQKIQDWTKNGPLHLSQQQLDNVGHELTTWFSTHKDTLTTGALSTVGTVGEILTGLFLVLFSTFFLLRDGRKIGQFLIGLLPERARTPMFGAAESAWSTLVSYVRATVLVAFIDAAGIGIAIGILGVPLPFPLIALIFLGAFIPIVGATVSGAVAVLVALVANGPVTALILLAAVIGVQQLEGHVLQPLIMGRAVAIHPLAVILGIGAGVVLAGIPGALVAVPIIAVLNTAIRHLVRVRREERAGVPPDEAEADVEQVERAEQMEMDLGEVPPAESR
jgi:predicted PurR-regulated permease PerM